MNDVTSRFWCSILEAAVAVIAYTVAFDVGATERECISLALVAIGFCRIWFLLFHAWMERRRDLARRSRSGGSFYDEREFDRP
jgi:hypothetical protein